MEKKYFKIKRVVKEVFNGDADAWSPCRDCIGFSGCENCPYNY